MLQSAIEGNFPAEECQKPCTTPSVVPAGLEALYTACRFLYPDQPNPLQVTAVVKYWLGGPDPLDYISMYYNQGDIKQHIPPHWHYISFGLSDLHGDGRVHEAVGPDQLSGFGFELTMRVKCDQGQTTPPTWPAALMQSLSNYIFHSETNFCPGDHISWHNALDNSDSCVQHMLIVEDQKLLSQQTPFGKVSFMQIVGVVPEELQAAQRWNGCGVLNIMRRFPESGGPLYVTDMNRQENIFDLDQSAADEVDEGIEKEGSNLSGASSKISWSSYGAEVLDHPSNSPTNLNSEAKDEPHLGAIGGVNEQSAKTFTHLNSYSGSFMEGSTTNSMMMEDMPIESLSALHLVINLESALLLPLALRGRLKHGRHFTFKSLLNNSAVTFLTPSVDGSFVTRELPYAVRGPWLQVLINPHHLEKMLQDLSCLSDSNEDSLPLAFEWPEEKLKITVVGNDQ